MSVKSRILTIRLMEKATAFPEYAGEIGLKMNFIRNDREKEIRNTQGEKDNGYKEKRENDESSNENFSPVFSNCSISAFTGR